MVIGAKAMILPLKKGEEKSFVFNIQQGEVVVIDVEQIGIDVGLTLMTADQHQIYYHDSPNGKYGPETFEFAPDSSGAYLLKIKPLEEEGNAIKGKFSIRLYEPVQRKETSPLVTLLSPGQMKKDLKVFRSIREKANSGFYRYRNKREMDSIYDWAYQQVKAEMHIVEFYKVLLVLTDFEGSCHNGTDLPYSVIDYIPTNKGFFPYYMKWIGQQMVINNAGMDIPLGSRVLSINGMPDTAIMQRFYKYFPVDGYNMTRKKVGSVDNSFGWRYPFEFGAADSFVVKYTEPYSKKILTKIMASISLDEKSKNYQNRYALKFDSIIDPEFGDKYSFEVLNPSTALLRIRVFDMASNDEDPAYAVYCHFLDSIFTHIKEQSIPNLIIDIRGNPGGSGSNAERLFSYLSDTVYRENTEAYISFLKVPYPQYYVWNSSFPQNVKREQKDLEKELKETYPTSENGKHLQDQQLNPYWQPDTAHTFKGNLYLLVDENVGSAASHFASYISGHTDAKVIGMETIGGYYGHNGHTPVKYRLPNSNILTRFSIVHVTQDAPVKPTQPVGRGIIPDVEVSQSFEDFMLNTDTQMKYVLDLIEKNAPKK